jgi:hypothetical protein
MSIYTPPGCTTLDKSTTKQQIRLGVQGFPGTGKTWAALTFPNPIVLNLDRGLGAHQGRSDVIEIPFYDSKFSGGKGQLKDKLITWLESEGMKLSSEQTLVFDGCSSLEVSYHQWFALNQHNFLTKQGKVDDFAEFQVKKKYFGELHELFKSLKCDLIFISHESERADKPTTVGQPGTYSGKIRPLVTGAYGDIIVRDYTDWFRQHASDKPKDYASITPESLSNWGMKSVAEFKSMCEDYPRNTIYFWQTEGDNIFDGKCSSLINFPRFIPATYKSFTKYMRKNTI